jgi:hypothetical protein
MEQIIKLLEEISILNKKNADELEKLDATGERFNIFRVCGINHYENTHSAILAEFLSPNGSHGLKSKLLECFIENLGNKLTIDCTNARVYREYFTDEGRIDILIEDNQGYALIIENKIYAKDQWEQLKRYDNFAAKKYGEGKYQILYLTLFGKDASEQSGDGVVYIPVSYKTDIINWLEQCVSITGHYPIVRETISQYINHLKQLTHQDMDTKNKEEIINMIIADRQLIESAHYVTSIWQECHQKIHASVPDTIKRISQELGLEYDQDFNDRIENEAAFVLSKKEWNDNYRILFWFGDLPLPNYYELYIGVIMKNGNGEIKEKLRKYLSDFNVKNYERYSETDDWVWGIKWYDNISLSEFPEKLSYDAIKEMVEIILKKLNDFKE